MKRKWMIIIAAFLVVILTGTTVFFLTANRNRVANQDGDVVTPTAKKDKELLLGFDNYDEITKTGLRFTDLFGKTAVNSDKTYITQGEGSWMVCPAGDPAKNIIPQFRMRCIETSFKTNNFDSFEKVTMDIYNASDKDVTIQWFFTVLDGSDMYVDTNPTNYILKANEWTTCEYALVDEEFNSYFHMNMVKYMTVNFLEKNQDVTLYFDNLQGHYMDEERVRSAMECNFWEGVGFEKSTDKYFFTSAPGESASSMRMSRVAYKDTNLADVDESLGDYVLSADITDKLWPSVIPNYGEVIPAGSVLSFMIYVEADEETVADMTFRIECLKSLDEWVSNQVLQASFKFNEWQQVDIVLKEDSTVTRAFVNLDDNYGNYKLGKTKATLYMDNFIVTEKKEEVVVDKDGTVTLKNPYNRKEIQYIVEKPVKAGDIISFDIDFNMDEAVAVWVLGDDTWLDEWYAYGYEEWTGQKFVQTVAQSDSEFFYIMVQYRDESGEYEKNEATIRNIKISDTVTLKGNADTNYATYTFKQPVAAGNHIMFDIDVNPAQSVNIWVMGDGMWEQEFYAKAFATWDGKQTITADIRESTQKLTLFVQFNDDSFDWTKTEITVGKIKVAKGYLTKQNKVSVGKDGTVTIKNLSGGQRVSYTFDKKVKAGQNVSFNVDVRPAQRIAVWLMDQDYKEYYAYDYEVWTGEKTISVDAPVDMERVYVLVEFRDESKKWSKNVVTITEPKISLPNLQVEKDGSVVLRNSLNANYRSYKFELPVKAYQNATFDIDITPAQDVSVWLMGDSMWESEYYAYQYENWTGKQTISADVWEDTKTLTVYVQFNDTNVDLTKNVITISKPVLKAANVEEKEDGTVILRNSTGTKRLTYVFDKTVKKGQAVSIDVDVEQDQNMAIWIMSHGYVEYAAVAKEPWAGTNTISATIPENLSKVRILIEFRDESIDLTKNEVTISNFTIKDAQIEEMEDGSVLLRNHNNATTLQYTWKQSVKAGSEISFDVETSYDKYIAVFVISPAAGNTEYFAKEYAPGAKISVKDTITKNESSLWIWIRFRNAEGVDDKTTDKTGVMTYIKNLAYSGADDVTGIEIKNPENKTDLSYTINQAFKAGSTISFDVECSTEYPVAVWILGDGSWSKEYYANGYVNRNGKLTITDTIDGDVSNIMIYVQYRNNNYEKDTISDKTGYITTISNISITEP